MASEDGPILFFIKFIFFINILLIININYRYLLDFFKL
jgi:hypothetical protein